MYVYIYIYICIYVCIYIYIYVITTPHHTTPHRISARSSSPCCEWDCLAFVLIAISNNSC